MGDTVVVSRIPRGTTKMQLKRHFEKRSHGGGNIGYILHPFVNDQTVAVINYIETKAAQTVIISQHAINSAKIRVKALPRQMFTNVMASVDPLVVIGLPDLEQCFSALRSEFGVSPSYNNSTGEMHIMGSLLQLQCAQAALDSMYREQQDQDARDLYRMGGGETSRSSLSESLTPKQSLDGPVRTKRGKNGQNSLKFEQNNKEDFDERLLQSLPARLSELPTTEVKSPRSAREPSQKEIQRSPGLNNSLGDNESPFLRNSKQVDEIFSYNNRKNRSQLMQSVGSEDEVSLQQAWMEQSNGSLTRSNGYTNPIQPQISTDVQASIVEDFQKISDDEVSRVSVSVEFDRMVFEFLLKKYDSKLKKFESDYSVKISQKVQGDFSIVKVTAGEEDTLGVSASIVKEKLVSLYQSVFFTVISDVIRIEDDPLKQLNFDRIVKQVQEDYKSDLVIELDDNAVTIVGKRLYVNAASEYLRKMMGLKRDPKELRRSETARDVPKPKLMFVMQSQTYTGGDTSRSFPGAMNNGQAVSTLDMPHSDLEGTGASEMAQSTLMSTNQLTDAMQQSLEDIDNSFGSHTLAKKKKVPTATLR